jgi:hypothetical protein
MDKDFEGYWHMKRRNMAYVANIDNHHFLDVKLHQGCVGTTDSHGCGFMGVVPFQDRGSPEVATLEYTCVSPACACPVSNPFVEPPVKV